MGKGRNAMTSQIHTMPLIPMRGMLVFPYMMIHLDIGRPASIAALEQAMMTDHEVLLVTQRDAEIENPEERDLFDVGTVAEIQRLVKLPDGSVRILAEGQTRGKIRVYRKLDGYVEAEVETYDDEELGAHTVENDALIRSVIDQFESWVKQSGKVPAEALVSVAFIDDAGRMADLIASHLNLRLETRQELLSCIDVRERLEKLSSVLARELEILEIEKKIDARVHERMTKTQKEYYLREKIKSIREELGEDSQRSAEVAEYRERLEEGEYPENVQKTVERELQRMESMSERSPENDVIRTYVDWLLDLPWQHETQEQLDIRAARDVLERDHYGLKDVKERILDYLAVRQLMPDKAAPILCLVGPPGVGKTSLGSSIARAMGRAFVHASLGGVRDEAEIRGHRRTYIGAMPGRIIEGIRSVKAKNPVFLLDEIDKMAESYQGDPAAALLEVLDPAQNKEFVDHYLDVPFDLSRVLWIVTANNLGNIPRPLRDRMEILTLSSYTEYEKLVIARRYLVPRQRTENGLKAKDIRLGTGVLEETIASYTRESGVRELERLIGRICRKAARRIVEGEETPIRVTKKQLADYLGKPKYLETKAEKQPQVGVVTGMAWTEVGGDILPTQADPDGPARRRHAGIGAGRPHVRPQPRRRAASARGLLRKRRHPHPSARRRHSERRPLGRHHDGDGHRFGAARPQSPQRRRHDRRNHAARQHPADWRPQGKDACGLSRRHPYDHPAERKRARPRRPARRHPEEDDVPPREAHGRSPENRAAAIISLQPPSLREGARFYRKEAIYV